MPFLTRRTLLQIAALQSTKKLCAGSTVATRSPALHPDKLAQFVDPLPIPLVAQPSGTRHIGGKGSATVPFYRVTMQPAEVKVHRDLPATRMWCYGGSSPGPTFETSSGEGLLVEWVNNLPEKHFLPIDHNLHGAEADKPEVRTVVHVHGAKAPPNSDGFPESWYTPGKSVESFYPNHQDATMLWYHDHAMGITRLNTYAGLFGLFFVRDSFEDALHLPKAPYEIPLVICDRLFREDGQLDYLTSGVKDAPWVPEVFGNVCLLNGKLYPYIDVEPRKYRFRVLNACNGRFLHLSLSDGHTIHQIGTDQGLLPAPVPLQISQLAPGERADLIIDFTNIGSGPVLLKNDILPIAQFRRKPLTGRDTSALPATLRALTPLPESSAVKTRELALFEIESPKGDPMQMLLNGMHWDMPVTENPVINTTEIWSLINTTDDSHPIHLHLVRFQILDRRQFDVFDYRNQGKIRFTGPVVPPDPYEAGWKDTIRAHPRMITRIIVKFEGYAGRYVWHCHVAEHEDNEMMRPYDVLPEPPVKES